MRACTFVRKKSFTRVIEQTFSWTFSNSSVQQAQITSNLKSNLQSPQVLKQLLQSLQSATLYLAEQAT